jgi:lactoylglutathione lyase
MRLAKPSIDIGLSTNALAPMLAFWQRDIGLPFDHLLKIRAGIDQHRHGLMGSVLKINHVAAPLPDTPPTGYRELIIARDGLNLAERSADPDGNLVRLVPPGEDGVSQIGVRLVVRDLAAHRAFYRQALGLEEIMWPAGAAFRAGESLLLVEESPEATADAPFQGRGWRYLTFQVFEVDAEHAHILGRGGREAMPPTTLGTTARISMVKDPDGNWIEISQRASLTGPLP